MAVVVGARRGSGFSRHRVTETVDSGPAKRVYDLPGDSLRLTSKSIGVTRVFVNGVPTIENGESTGELTGTVLRSGVNTDTVATH